MATITKLPLELLCKIASQCAYPDLVSLGRTCRQLHMVSNDDVVLQASFLGHLEPPASSEVPSKTALRDVLHRHLATKDPSQAGLIWRRLSFAASQLPEIIDEIETLLVPYESVPVDGSSPRPAPVDPALKGIVGALGTLTILGQLSIGFGVTAALTGLVARLLDIDFWQQWEPNHDGRRTLTARVTFCLAAGILNEPVRNNRGVLMQLVSTLYTNAPPSVLAEELRLSFEGLQTEGFLVASIFPWLSNEYCRHRGGIPDLSLLPFLSGAGTGHEIPLPDGSQLADGEGLGRFARSLSAFNPAPSWSKWLRGCVDALLDDLSGEWVGSYSSSMGVYPMDDPLRRIHFVSREDPEDPDLVRVAAKNCIDGVGPFELRGTISRSTSRATLTKNYIGSHMWRNDCVLTPFGIIGCWGAGPTHGYGYVWMYKKAWVKKWDWREPGEEMEY
ncbi:hypothetical protein OQA88_9899 [Cercophora sp. LCS_1]